MAETLEIGSELAGYRIESMLARGGMGAVYLASRPRVGGKAVVKVILPEYAADLGFRERFEREARAAAELDHPNVVPIYDFGEAEGVLFIAMRYIDGPSLQALLAREGPSRPRGHFRFSSRSPSPSTRRTKRASCTAT